MLIDNFIAGDTFSIEFNDSDYPASEGYSLDYCLRGPSVINITAQNSNGVYKVEETSSETTNWAAGSYTLFLKFELSGKVFTKQIGLMNIRPSLDKLTNYDGRTHVKKTLDNIEAILENRVTKDVQSYTINGRQLVKMPMTDLLKLYDKYKYLYKQEQQKEKYPSRDAVKAVFTRG